MPTKLTRKDYAAVILALAGKPLHYNQDLNYIVEMIRGENSEKTPWNSMSTVLQTNEDRFVRTAGNGMFDLNIGENTDRRSFVLSKIGEEKYNTICELLRTHNFLDDSGNLVWTEQKNYRHTAADAPLQADMPEEEDKNSNSNYYLLSWNPAKGAWFYGDEGNHAASGEEGYFRAVEAIADGKDIQEPWRCINSHVAPGDKIFMIKLGENEKGIFAFGIVEKAPYRHIYESEEKQYIDVKFINILNYKEKILPQQFLREKFPNQDWSPQASGISINKEYGEKLRPSCKVLRLRRRRTFVQ